MLTLTSPSGTRSTLLFPRSRDNKDTTFDEWPFLSVHFWGESPVGTWTLEVTNMGTERPQRRGQGLLRKWQLIFYGTEESPVRLPRNVEFRDPSPPPQPIRPSPPVISGFGFNPSSFAKLFQPFSTRIKRWISGKDDEDEESDALETK